MASNDDVTCQCNFCVYEGRDEVDVGVAGPKRKQRFDTYDGSTHRNQSFFDLRLCICYRGNLVNLHLVAMSMFERHTTLNIFNMISKFMDVLYNKWCAKLIGMLTDGENTMIGQHAGVMTRIVMCVEHKLRHGAFIRKVLDLYHEHLAKFWLPQNIDQIEANHCALLKAYNTNNVLRAAIDNHGVVTMFNDAWG
ncbi:unnamed protein product [Sphagnum balticum]